jgi:4-hydroxythreonine-4-phosphate dehydrogenase
MMLANEQLRVSLVTGHLPLGKVSKAVTRALIRKTTLQTAQSLQRLWGIRKPRIAVLGLNPHAGEGGLLGSEEKRIDAEIRALRKNRSFTVDGPFSADTFFALNQRAFKKERYDAVVCMYHDQALIPVKLLDFGKTVNITLGLPIIRTSVDHGTGFDIVGTGKADPSSLLEAIRLADQLAHKVNA